MDFTPKQAK